MKKNRNLLVLVCATIITLVQISCSIRTFDCSHLKYLSLSKEDNNRQHINYLYGVSSSNDFFDDDRVLFRKGNLRKSDKIKALEEYLCFYKNEMVSNKNYSQKYGRIQNRIKLSKENIKFPVEVEALYSLTSMLFEDNVAISPVIVNKKTGKICNFERKEMDEVYTIYRTWFRRMKKEDFSRIKWPLKNSDYMWLGEDIVENVEELIKKEI